MRSRTLRRTVEEKTRSSRPLRKHPGVIVGIIGLFGALITATAAITVALIQRNGSGGTTIIQHADVVYGGPAVDLPQVAKSAGPREARGFTRITETPKVKWYLVEPDCGSISQRGVYQPPPLPSGVSVDRTCHIVVVTDDPLRPDSGRAGIFALKLRQPM